MSVVDTLTPPVPAAVDPPHVSSRPAFPWILVPALALAAFAFWHMGRQPLWEDETFTLVFAQQPLPALLHSLATSEPHLPPYFLLLRGWEALAGPSAFAERWLSVACFLLTGLVVWRTARVLAGRSAGWLAFGFWAVQPDGFWYGEEVRMYAPLMLWTALTVYLLARALRSRRRIAWLLCSLAELATLWTHYAGVLVVLLAGAVCLLFAPPASRKRALAAVALPPLTYLPWLWYVRHLAPPTGRPAGTLANQAFEAGREVLFGFGGPTLPDWLTIGSLVLLGLALAWALWKGDASLRFAALAVAVPLLAPAVVPPLHLFFSGRYLCEVAPLLCLFAAVSLDRLARRSPPAAAAVGAWAGLGSVAALAVVLTPTFHQWYAYPDAVAFVRAQEQPGQALVANSGVDPTARYYYQHVEQGSLPVTTLPSVHPGSVAATEQAARQLGQTASGVWLVEDAAGTWDGDRVAERALSATLIPAQQWRFRDVTVRYFVTPKGLAAQRAAPQSATFGNTIRLVRFGVTPAGGDLLVSFQWQALRPIARDYTVFVHLLDGAGHLVAQQDSPPAGGMLPTSRWAVATSVADLHRVSWQGDPTAVQLEVGWYDGATGDRLPLGSGPATNSLNVGPVSSLLSPVPGLSVPAGGAVTVRGIPTL